MKNYHPKPQIGRRDKSLPAKPLGYRLQLVGGKLVRVAIGRDDKK